MHLRHIRFRQNPALFKSLLALLCVIGLLLMIVGGLFWYRASDRHQRLANLNQRLDAASRQGIATLGEDRLKDLAKDANALGRPLPEADYVALYRRWQSAMARFDQVSAALGNRYLEPQARDLLNDLHQNLLELRNAGEKTLSTNRKLPAGLAWKIHNLKGNVSVLLAYSVLYHEQEGRKAASFLADALEDYKSAIHLVDQASTSSLERVMPRWNLELITGIGEYSKIGFAEIPQPDMAKVRDQLQAFIPQEPGFSPGIPLETRVEK